MGGTFISAFTGIGGLDLGLERAGWTCLAQVEIDRTCRRILDARWPTVPKFGDVRDFGDAALKPIGGEQHARRVDLLCGGFPCQDVSVAGRRAGLAGARSGLFFEFVRVAREIQPRWVLVENVPGLLSSNDGRDFACVLAELGDAGYFVEWRVLDSRWFGVPQRRRRVFLVGHLGGPPARSVLFEREGGGGDPAPVGASRAIASGEIARSLSNVGGGNDYGANKGTVVVSPAVGATLKANTGRNHVEQDYIVASALRASDGYDSEDGTGRQPALVVESVALRGRDGGATAELGGDEAHALRSSSGGGDKAHILIAPALAVPLTSGSHPNSAIPTRHMEDDSNLVVYRKSKRAATNEDDESGVPDDYANTLNGFDGGDTRATDLIAYSIMPMQSGKNPKAREVSVLQPLRAQPPGDGRGGDVLLGASLVRRLTPTECERLQGFPDGWTCLEQRERDSAYATESCRCPDGPRYAVIGNAVTVNVAEWIGRRIGEAI